MDATQVGWLTLLKLISRHGYNRDPLWNLSYESWIELQEKKKTVLQSAKVSLSYVGKLVTLLLFMFERYFTVLYTRDQ